MTPHELVSGAGELISLPRAYHRVNEMLDDPRYGPVDIGHVIGHEPALTARLLRLANSAALRLPTKVDSVPMAITVLGTRSLRELLLATAVATAFERINTKLVDVADFWHHSIYCGMLTRLLSRRLGWANSEQVFIGGLLHDLGKLVIYHQLPYQASQVLTQIKRSQQPAYLIERELLGFDHARVGEALLKSWDLPEIFCEIVAHHHEPQASSAYARETQLVYLANSLCKKIEPGHKLGDNERGDEVLCRQVAVQLGLSGEAMEELMLQADVQSIELFGTLFSGTPASA